LLLFWISAAPELDFQVSSKCKSLYALFYWFSFLCRLNFCCLLVDCWYFSWFFLFYFVGTESSHSDLAFWAEGFENWRPNYCKFCTEQTKSWYSLICFMGCIGVRLVCAFWLVYLLVSVLKVVVRANITD